MEIVDIKVTQGNNIWIEFDNKHYRLINTGKNERFKHLSNENYMNVLINQEQKIVSFGNGIKFQFHELYKESKNVDEI